MTQFNFYGRKSELQTLSAFYANASTNLGVIYGRRRVGKSLLIKESLKRSGLPFIYLECKQTSEENNLRQLMSLLGGSVRISVSGEVIPGAAQRGCPLYLRCSMPDLMR